MNGRVIQGFFVGGRPRASVPLAQPKAVLQPPGPPAPAFVALATLVQARGRGDSFQVDPAQLGLVSGGGRMLPDAVRGRMEAALGADFTNVRIHVGPQAERIGAVAFTTGSDIYFAPGRFQPDTVQGQQLLGHELVHVVQQRAGRVRNPTGAGAAVVQDHLLEAEADRLGHRAATGSGATVQRVRATPAASLPGRAAARSFGLGPVPRPSVVQRAGDKVAFVAGTPAVETDKQLATRIGAIVAIEGQRKKGYKDQIEARKDLAIVSANRLDFADRKDARVKVLHQFHDEYTLSGWSVKNIVAQVRSELKAQVTVTMNSYNTCTMTSKATHAVLYSIVGGADRFGPETDGIYVKAGSTKEYVRDSAGLYVSRFVVRGCSRDQMQQLFTYKAISPRNTTLVIGNQKNKYNFGIRDKTDLISQSERAFLQQRDGSGGDQRMLSTTRNMTRKIFSNHGETFTDHAVIKIDLSKIPRAKIVDVHLEASHQYKTSLPNIEFNNSAGKELELYKYSAEKNREILLDEIPLAAVTQITVEEGVISMIEAKARYDLIFIAQEEQRKKLEEKAKQEEIKRKMLEEKARQEEEERRLAKVATKTKHVEQKKKLESLPDINTDKAADLVGDVAEKLGLKKKFNRETLIVAIADYASDKGIDLRSAQLGTKERNGIKSLYDQYMLT
jgi:hypothetical protein